MHKKRSYQPILIVVTVLFLILASFLTYYFGFYKQTIFGVPSEVKVSDIIKFHAIAQVGGRAGITCYGNPTFIIGYTGNPLPEKELKDGCAGLPCNLYDPWSYTPKQSGTYTLHVVYDCTGVSNPPNDKLTFSVKEATTIPVTCSDTDSGDDIYLKGTTTWYPYPTSPDYSLQKSDNCVSETSLEQWHCGSDEIGYPRTVSCPTGTKCSNGICVKQTTTPPEETILDCKTGDKGSFCRDNKRYFLTTSVRLIDGIRKCVDEERLFEICSDDETCNKETGCVPNVKEGTQRNKKCVNGEQYSSVNYEEFGSTTTGGQWRTVNEFCIGDQFCNSETLQCELKPDAPKVKTNEAAGKKEETAGKKEEAKEFDFNEFFKTYGVVIGISAFLLVIAVIFIIVTMRRKNK